LLQIDGGINSETIAIAGQYGVDLYVAGSAVFGSPDYKAVLDEMNRELGALNERI
jgi:ribulose-phosphate 3-epimerase